jgi:VWFA-related protein
VVSVSHSALVTLALTVCAASAQTQAPPLFRASTRLVQVSVLVHDKAGHPVAGLAKEDFTVLDAGKPQQIRYFQVNRSESAKPRRPLPPDTFTNRPLESGESPNATVILLDSLNTPVRDQQYARAQVLKFLAGQIRPGDRVAVYLLASGRFKVLQDFTSDAARLVAALQRWRGNLSRELDASPPEAVADASIASLDDLDTTLGMGSTIMSDFFTTQRVEMTLATLEMVANHIKYLPGRKNLVWFSAGFPLTIGFDKWGPGYTGDRRSFGPEVQRTVRALNDANVAMYPVDARGLLPGSPVGPQPRPVDSMLELAARTGGRAFYNTNDLHTAVRVAIDDAAVTYTLAFYPAGEPDDHFHSIKVTLNNRPGTRLRYRQGYFAFTNRESSEKQKREELERAAWSPLELSAIGASVRYFLPPKNNKLSLTVVIEPFDLTFDAAEDGGETRYHARVDVIFIQRDAGGATLKGQTNTLNLALKPQTYLDTLKNGLRFGHALELEPGARELRVVLRDAPSGNSGSVIAALPVN